MMNTLLMGDVAGYSKSPPLHNTIDNLNNIEQTDVNKLTMLFNKLCQKNTCKVEGNHSFINI